MVYHPPTTSDYFALHESISARLAEMKGGSGSGNFGHAGRPGEQGGSSSNGGGEKEDSGWKKEGDGYRATFGGKEATLSKEGKQWVLKYDGQEHKLPKKASFDHAEGIIKQSQNKKSLPLEYLKSEYKFASTQVNVGMCSPDGDEVARQILALGRRIPDDLLTEEGREELPHVTLFYGLHDDSPDEVRELLKDEPVCHLTFGPVDCFYGEDTGQDYDVIILRVFSPDLVRLHSLIEDEVETTSTFDYNPHCTLAHVEKGAGRTFVTMANKITGLKLTAGAIIFSDREGEQTNIPLGGADTMARSIDRTLLATGIQSRFNQLLQVKGGAGSGNFGHAGREGERGGSTSGKAGSQRHDAAKEEVNSKAEHHNERADKHAAAAESATSSTAKKNHEEAADLHAGTARKFEDIALRLEHGTSLSDLSSQMADAKKQSSRADSVSEKTKGKKSLKHCGYPEDHEDNDPDKPLRSTEMSNFSTLAENIRNRVAELSVKGGSGSGNFGHAGRPGEKGGSSSEGESGGSKGDWEKSDGRRKEEHTLKGEEADAVVFKHRDGSYRFYVVGHNSNGITFENGKATTLSKAQTRARNALERFHNELEENRGESRRLANIAEHHKQSAKFDFGE